MKIIGITGKARSGKDTAGDVLYKKQGFYKMAFAKPIKDALERMFLAYKPEFNFGQNKEDNLEGLDVSPRVLAQTLGTEWGRNIIHEDIWVKIMEKRINTMRELTNVKGFVITDVRFENEAQWVRASEGILIHITREDIKDVAEHSSENGIKPVEGDKMIINNGTIEDLHKNVIEAVQG